MTAISKGKSMSGKKVRHSRQDPFVLAIGEGFATTVRRSAWTFEENDLDTWLEALGTGETDPDWEAHFGWYLGLTESIAHVAMALSMDGQKEKKIRREALLLAAVIVSASCRTPPSSPMRLRGRPCSGVTVDAFDDAQGDRERILALYKDRYASSGLPLCDCCGTAAAVGSKPKPPAPKRGREARRRA